MFAHITLLKGISIMRDVMFRYETTTFSPSYVAETPIEVSWAIAGTTNRCFSEGSLYGGGGERSKIGLHCRMRF